MAKSKHGLNLNTSNFHRELGDGEGYVASRHSAHTTGALCSHLCRNILNHILQPIWTTGYITTTVLCVAVRYREALNAAKTRYGWSSVRQRSTAGAALSYNTRQRSTLPYSTAGNSITLLSSLCLCWVLPRDEHEYHNEQMDAHA